MEELSEVTSQIVASFEMQGEHHNLSRKEVEDIVLRLESLDPNFHRRHAVQKISRAVQEVVASRLDSIEDDPSDFFASVDNSHSKRRKTALVVSELVTDLKIHQQLDDVARRALQERNVPVAQSSSSSSSSGEGNGTEVLFSRFNQGVDVMQFGDFDDANMDDVMDIAGVLEGFIRQELQQLRAQPRCEIADLRIDPPEAAFFDTMDKISAEDVLSSEHWELLVLKTASTFRLLEDAVWDEAQAVGLCARAVRLLGTLSQEAAGEKIIPIFIAVAAPAKKLLPTDSSQLGRMVVAVLWRMMVEIPSHAICFTRQMHERLLEAALGAVEAQLRHFVEVDPYASWAEAWFRNPYVRRAFCEAPSLRNRAADLVDKCMHIATKNSHALCLCALLPPLSPDQTTTLACDFIQFLTKKKEVRVVDWDVAGTILSAALQQRIGVLTPELVQRLLVALCQDEVAARKRGMFSVVARWFEFVRTGSALKRTNSVKELMSYFPVDRWLGLFTKVLAVSGVELPLKEVLLRELAQLPIEMGFELSPLFLAEQSIQGELCALHGGASPGGLEWLAKEMLKSDSLGEAVCKFVVACFDRIGVEAMHTVGLLLTSCAIRNALSRHLRLPFVMSDRLFALPPSLMVDNIDHVTYDPKAPDAFTRSLLMFFCVIWASPNDELFESLRKTLAYQFGSSEKDEAITSPTEFEGELQLRCDDQRLAVLSAAVTATAFAPSAATFFDNLTQSLILGALEDCLIKPHAPIPPSPLKATTQSPHTLAIENEPGFDNERKQPIFALDPNSILLHVLNFHCSGLGGPRERPRCIPSCVIASLLASQFDTTLDIGTIAHLDLSPPPKWDLQPPPVIAGPRKRRPSDSPTAAAAAGVVVSPAVVELTEQIRASFTVEAVRAALDGVFGLCRQLQGSMVHLSLIALCSEIVETSCRISAPNWPPSNLGGSKRLHKEQSDPKLFRLAGAFVTYAAAIGIESAASDSPRCCAELAELLLEFQRRECDTTSWFIGSTYTILGCKLERARNVLTCVFNDVSICNGIGALAGVHPQAQYDVVRCFDAFWPATKQTSFPISMLCARWLGQCCVNLMDAGDIASLFAVAAVHGAKGIAAIFVERLDKEEAHAAGGAGAFGLSQRDFKLLIDPFSGKSTVAGLWPSVRQRIM